MTDQPFTPPPPGMLSEQIDLPDHQMSLGLMHREGEGVRVFIWDGECWRHLTQDAAEGYATYLDENPYGDVLKPVSEALRTLAAKIGEVETSAMFRRASATVMRKFSDMPASSEAWSYEPLDEMVIEGHA